MEQRYTDLALLSIQMVTVFLISLFLKKMPAILGKGHGFVQV
jgi:hypothetical protein